jgi:Uma2 family endonuclease
MSADARQDDFWRHWSEIPEGKLELIDGRLVISTMTGSRWIMREILRDYGPGYLLPYASSSLWRRALQEAYDPHPRPHTPAEWRVWSDALAYEPDVAPAGPRSTREHRRLIDLLRWSLWHFSETTDLGQVHGPDFVIRLGENGLTPDHLFIDQSCLDRYYELYLEGPPPLAIEVTMSDTADQERVLKRRLYEEAGIPEYWLIEPEIPQIRFLHLQDGRYQARVFDADAIRRIVEGENDLIYESVTIPGLSLSLKQLWTMEEHDWQNPWPPLLPIETPPREGRWLQAREDGVGWDSIPYCPRVDLHPVPIRFEEFASWCGRAKFERYSGGIKIGGTEATRRIAGMLLMTFGLIEVVRLAHPREWVTFLDPSPFLPTVEAQTDLAMRLARYERDEHRPEEVYYSGTISRLPDLWGDGDTEEECRRDLTAQVKDWILLRLARREALPRFD